MRQKVRKTLLFIAFLLFPVTCWYFSPYLIIRAASEHIMNGSFIVFMSLLIFSMFFEAINKLNSKVKTKIKKFLYSCVDVSNAIRIARAKKFYSADDDFISGITFSFGDYKFLKYSFLKDSNFSDFSFIDDSIDSIQKLEKFSKIMRFKWSRKNIRYSDISEVVGFSYVFLKEMEISNVINIIEGVRYGISKEKIRQLLIL